MDTRVKALDMRTSFDPANLSHVPAELRDLPVWLHWKLLLKKDGKADKVPYYSHGKARGKTDTPDDRVSLVTFDLALTRFDSSRFAGLGVALGRVELGGPILSGIDCDNCITQNVLSPPVQEIIAAGAGAYAEISPSGLGIKMFGTGDIGTTKKANGLEIYSQGRFFTVTGRRIEGDHLADLTAAAQRARELFKAPPDSGAVRLIPEGGRNNTLYDLAARLRLLNVAHDRALVALRGMNAACCDPPLGDAEVLTILKHAWDLTPSVRPTDLYNAERLVALYGHDWRHTPERGWLYFDGISWRDDRQQKIMLVAADTARGLSIDAVSELDDDRRKKLLAWALKSESKTAQQAMVALSQPRPEVADLLERFDQQPTMLVVGNGVVDLETGELREGRREDRLRLRADVMYDLNATAPRFIRFLDEIFDGDQVAMVPFMQRALGYSISGLNSEQAVFIGWGPGKNGKTTLFSTVRRILGEYAQSVRPETLLTRDRGAMTNDLARMFGIRFGPTGEVEEGRKMAESIVKEVSGGDSIAARFLHREFFDFVPVVKLWIATNHRPVITGTDYAIWRRIFLVPFNVTIPEERRDKNLEAKLMAEAPGILNWLIAGFLRWRQMGLAPPESVLAATEKYRHDMDRVGVFLRECVVENPALRTKCGELYKAYAAWCEGAGVRPLSRPRFREKLINDHKAIIKTRDGYEHYEGLVLVDPDSLDKRP